MLGYIYAGITLCLGIFSLTAFTTAFDTPGKNPEVVTTLARGDAKFKEIDEVSGIAIAGFRDENDYPLLWSHNEKTTRISLISTFPGSKLYVGAITMPGKKTRDAEDIATVYDQGKGTIYLEDAGSNRKDMPLCVKYAHKKDNPSQCVLLDSVVQNIDKKSADEKNAGKEDCQERGNDWIWLDKSDYLDPGVHPSIRRIPEPTYLEVLRGKLIVNTDVIEFDYPRLCGDKPCRELPGNKMTDIAAAYNTESLAVVVEPDHSHTAYLFTKAPLIHATNSKKQLNCKFDSDALSDVFRIRNIDTLSPNDVHLAEYVTTLNFSEYEGTPNYESSYRVTAANFLKLSGSQGLLLVRTNLSAYKWPVPLTSAKKTNSYTEFDIAGALKNFKPLLAAAPSTNEKQGVGTKQESVAQLDESTLYYMSECKGLPRCSVTMVRDNHSFISGDIDGNGHIDADDVKLLSKFISGEARLYCQASADVNGDNIVNEADLIYLQKFVENHGPIPIQSASPSSIFPMLSCGYYAYQKH